MNILVLCLANPTTNPRPNRLIQLLSRSGHDVSLVSYPFKKGALPVAKALTIIPPGRTIYHKAFYLLIQLCAAVLASFKLLPSIALQINNFRYGLVGTPTNQFAHIHYDLIVVENLELLPLAVSLPSFDKILFDAREYFTREFDNDLRFKFLELPIRRFLYIPYLYKPHKLITVSQGLADAYKAEFGLDMSVVRSVPPFHDFPVRPTSPNNIRLVHHGNAHRDRGLENLIEIVSALDDRFTLDLYLVGSSLYLDRLKAISRCCSRIRILPPVPFQSIVPTLTLYDIGLYYLYPSNFNTLQCLPNKLFEFIQARLAVAIGPSPCMAEVVNQYSCGFVSDQFSVASMIRTLQSLTCESIDEAKYKSSLAAHDLCYETESLKLLELIS